VFRDNREFTLVNVYRASQVSFTNCEFTNNRGEMFSVVESTVSVSDCVFKGNSDTGIYNSPNVRFTNCTFDADDDEVSADGKVTLKDASTGMTVTLHQSESEGLLYFESNGRYSVKVPHIFTEVVLLPDNGDGIILASKDGQYRFRVTGGFVMGFETTLEDAKKHVKENVDGAMVFEETGEGWWELSWWNGPGKGTRRFITNGESWAECEITGPGEARNAPGEYDELFEQAVESLEFSVG
jgi:hypothetical protein